jgi:putative transposase
MQTLSHRNRRDFEARYSSRMARQPRFTVPGYPHHVMQCGNNRQAVFADDEDRRTWLELLHTQAQAHQVAVHGYVLMNNHVHLLLTPQTQDGIPLMMQAIGRLYVRRFNRRHARTGTLWEGRYRSTVIESDRYLLACMAYIDLNPVRAGMVTTPADYPWSSHPHYAGLRSDPVLTAHPLYWALGNTPFAREQAYAQLVQNAQGNPTQNELGAAIPNRKALGSADFIATLQKRTLQRLVPGRAGRPRTVKT